MNIWHLRTTSDIDESTADAAMGALDTFYTAWAFQRAQGSVIRWAGEMTTVEADPVVVTPGTAWESAAGGNQGALPSQTGICVKWVAETGGRSGRGKNFLAPMNKESCGDDGKPTSACLTVIRNAAQELVAASAQSNEWAFGIYSRKDELLRDFAGASVMSVFSQTSSRRV